MSILDVFEPIYKLLPEVKAPETQPNLKTKMLWTAAILLIFYAMGSTFLVGVDLQASVGGQLQQIQFILASNIGTLITVGIGPIVLASIILQLLVGGKIVDIDLSNPKDKARFSSMQKLLAIVLCFFEAMAYTMGGYIVPIAGMLPFVILQIAFGSIILMYLDEVVSKYGIGSGISLFIAGGVAQTILWKIFNPFDISGAFAGLNGAGYLYLFINSIGTNLGQAIIQYLLPVIATIIIFFVVTFAEGIHVNIPITMGYHGMGGRFPVKLLYVSNIPVILAVALFANLQLIATITKNTPIVGTIFGAIGTAVTAPYGLISTILLQGTLAGNEGQILHAIIFLIVFMLTCVLFGKFWIELAGQGPEAVSQQLQKSGMYVPGFRRDPRIIRKILDRYIPPITIIGSAFVGLLAGFADLTNALGTGTGILLTVGIVYRFYEELARQQLMDSHPLIKKILG
jgi:preprotein translocase subunit SecY